MCLPTIGTGSGYTDHNTSATLLVNWYKATAESLHQSAAGKGRRIGTVGIHTTAGYREEHRATTSRVVPANVCQNHL